MHIFTVPISWICSLILLKLNFSPLYDKCNISRLKSLTLMLFQTWISFFCGTQNKIFVCYEHKFNSKKDIQLVLLLLTNTIYNIIYI